MKTYLTADEMQVLETLRSRRMVREDLFEVDGFTLDTIDGLSPNLVHGKLGLVKSDQAIIDRAHFYAPLFLDDKSATLSGKGAHLHKSEVQLA